MLKRLKVKASQIRGPWHSRWSLLVATLLLAINCASAIGCASRLEHDEAESDVAAVEAPATAPTEGSAPAAVEEPATTDSGSYDYSAQSVDADIMIEAAESQVEEPRDSVLYPARDSQVEPTPSTTLPISEAASQPTWNIFAEAGWTQARFRPKQNLRPVSQYKFVIDLALVDYNLENVSGRAVSQDVLTVIQEASEENPSTLRIVPLPDPRGLITYVDTDVALEIQPGLLEEFNNGSLISRPANVIKALREHANPSFVIGRALVRFNTLADQGDTAATFSIWYGGRPIDEVSHSICVTNAGNEHRACGTERPRAIGASGVDSMQLGRGSEIPDLALHILPVSDSLYALFRCNTCASANDRPVAWSLDRSRGSFQQFLATTFRPRLDEAVASRDQHLRNAILSSVGDAVAGVLFPPRQAGAQAAWKTLASLSQEVDGSLRPSFFARFAPHPEPSLAAPPLSLAWVPIPGGKSGHLAEGFRIEMPLPRQAYGGSFPCIGELRLFLPPLEDVDAELRVAFEEALPGIEALDEAAPDMLKIESSWPRLRDWLGDQSETATAQVLILLLHHDRNSLLLGLNGPQVPLTATSVRRTYTRPAVGVLAACGSGAPLADDFVTQFNRLDMYSLVASSMNVDAVLGGAYVRELLLEIAGATTDISLGSAHARAINKLFAEFGPQAFGLALLGDTGVRICGRPKRSDDQVTSTNGGY